jgi:hypothetical protein
MGRGALRGAALLVRPGAGYHPREMDLYHRTTIAEARAVMQRGFQDQKWGFEVPGLDQKGRLKLRGVWLTDRVLDEGAGPPGDAVLQVSVGGDPEVLRAFEVPGVLPEARLWVVPAAVLNPLAATHILGVDPRTSWWFERGQLDGTAGEPPEG